MFIFCDYKHSLILLLDPSFSVLSFYSVALMNHSCDPNVIVTYNGTVAEVRAVQEINPGEEVRKTPETVMFFIQTLPVNGKANIILSSLSSNPHLLPLPLPPQICDSYIDLLYPTEDRRERLLDSYFFTCQCSECSSKSKVQSYKISVFSFH